MRCSNIVIVEAATASSDASEKQLLAQQHLWSVQMYSLSLLVDKQAEKVIQFLQQVCIKLTIFKHCILILSFEVCSDLDKRSLLRTIMLYLYCALTCYFYIIYKWIIYTSVLYLYYVQMCFILVCYIYITY